MNRVLNIATTFNKLPSEVMGITDEYTAFCFDEAAAFILDKLSDPDNKPFYLEDIRRFEEMERKKKEKKKETKNANNEKFLKFLESQG